MILVGIPLIILLAAFVAYGMAALQHSNSTGLIGWLGKALANIPIIGGFSVSQILKLDAWITRQIGSHFKAVEQRAVTWVGALSTYVKIMAAAPMNVAAAMWALSYWLVHTEIGRQAKAHTRHAEITATHADAVAETAMKEAVGLARSHPGKVTQKEVTQIERVAMPHAPEWEWINHHWGALVRAVTAPVTLPGVVAKPVVEKIDGWTKRNLRWHNRRLARLEKLLGVTAFAAVLARTLGVSARCVRPGGNVSKVARSICGLSLRGLEDLLGFLADALLLTNICRALSLLEDGLGAIQPAITAFITDVETWACYGDNEKPPKLPEPTLDLPDLRPIVLDAL